MATQTDFDKLLVAWRNLQAKVNTTIPNRTSQIAAARAKINSAAGHGPRES